MEALGINQETRISRDLLQTKKIKYPAIMLTRSLLLVLQENN